MSSFTDSNLTFPQAQQAVRQVAIDLAEIDHRIARIAGAIEPHPTRALPGALRGTLQVVRSDLLQDAIATLETLATQSEEGYASEQIRLAEMLDLLACQG
jgi:coenzyme F420-reducing hydrogenase alpha subunit